MLDTSVYFFSIKYQCNFVKLYAIRDAKIVHGVGGPKSADYTLANKRSIIVKGLPVEQLPIIILQIIVGDPKPIF